MPAPSFGRQVVGGSLALSSVILPALVDWDFPGAVPLAVLVGVAIAGNIVAAFILLPRGERFVVKAVALLSAVLAAGGAFFAARWWIADRTSVWLGEIIIAECIGAAPGLLGVRVIRRLLR